MAVFVDKLHAEIAKIANISGVYIGDPDDRSTWGAHFVDNPTDEQARLCQEVINNIEFISDEEHTKNLQSRGDLLNDDWKVLRFIEKVFRTAKSGEDIFKATQDKDFQALLAKRQELRDAVKTEYTLKKGA